MPSKSKNKGNSWERDVANFLSTTYSSSFIRSPGSGAYIGGSNGHRKQMLLDSQIRNFKGDIVPGEGFDRLNIECKSFADFPFHQLFQGEVKILEGWLGQCLEVADEGDLNLLFLKFNRKGKWVVLEAKHEPHLDLERHLVYKSSKFGEWIVMDFAIFFEKNSEAIKQLAK
jgi:Holliday junction resolvase